MLTYNPQNRISAAEAYKHEWFEGKDFISISEDKIAHIMKNIKKSYVADKLQQAALMFIASQLISKQEKDILSAIFISLDKNGDGFLTKDELIEGYTKYYGNVELAKIEVASLMSIADVDNNGLIDYSEFILAAANKRTLLSKANIKYAFDLFDIVSFLLI